MSTFRIVRVVGVMAAGVLGFLSGCAVTEGPVNPGPSQPSLIRGKEPEPAPIAQRDVPPGESSLKKTKPDQPLVPAQP